MSTFLFLLTILVTFGIMEFNAWFLHKFVMHGFLWNLHEDHHVHKPGFFQKNDTFFLVFAVPSSLSIFLGSIYHIQLLLAIGIGILLYGIAYFLVHEVLIHRRFPKLRKKLFTPLTSRYLRVLEYAHKMHHKHLGKQDGESFGMLVVAPRYYKEFESRSK